MSEEEIKKIFSNNLARILEENKKTQRDLVDFIGVSSSTVSDWCNGKKLPRMDKVQSIANWLGIKNSDLLENKKETKPTYEDMIKIYTRGKSNLTQHEKMKLAQIILSDDED